ncbi:MULTISPECIES: hypothetical protein [unclassified Pseudoalteromonas]|uniref:hypothetical protein n=1 Tax=unclassified Pseudoalteromonas TaxID=194690 RepID=UPI000464686C|nr:MULTISPECIES: hypothetical protein [unclassified Pseudoalteromonas]
MDSISPKAIGIFLGVLYGISMRIFIEFSEALNFGGLVTISFMFLVPVAIGYIRIHFEYNETPNLTYRQIIVKAWQPIFIFLLVSIVTLLEGSICVAMALPAFMFFSSVGGVLAGFIRKRTTRKSNATLLSVALLPLALSPIELNFLHLSKTYEVTNSITINAPVDVVWQQLANVSYIDPQEIPFSLTQFIGVPKPLEASMNASGVGAVRTSKWQQGVVFKEVITDWQPNKKMLYKFEINPDLIPDGALDKHVKLGGEYFSPLYGGYQLSEDDSGNTLLTLKTTVQDNTNFGVYSRLWGEVIFQDFHHSLLTLMKNRAEKQLIAVISHS